MRRNSSRQRAQVQARIPFIAGYRKIGDYTIEITTPRPLSYFPNLLPYMLFSSPAQFARAGSWAEFAKAPSGTGPFRITELRPRISATLRRTDGYWDSARRARLDRMVLLPIPEATTRLAALRSGQVDGSRTAARRGARLRGRLQRVSGSYPMSGPMC